MIKRNPFSIGFQYLSLFRDNVVNQWLFKTLIWNFIIIILLIIGRIRFVSNKKKEQNSNELLQHKNQELTVHMLHLIEREEVIKELSEHLKNAAPENTSKNILKSKFFLFDLSLLFLLTLTIQHGVHQHPYYLLPSPTTGGTY